MHIASALGVSFALFGLLEHAYGPSIGLRTNHVIRSDLGTMRSLSLLKGSYFLENFLRIRLKLQYLIV